MATDTTTGRALAVAALTVLACCADMARAHGGVVEEDDVCVIKIDYFKGHFKIFQPRTDGHREYCEDLPAAAESVFVLEYLHDGLANVPLDFRIIRNVTGKGRFARWEDVAAIGDLDAVTEFHQPPAVEPDVFTAVYRFEAEGDYIGIVTATAGDTNRTYRAVFPFEVGFTGLGWWPLFVVAVLLIQLQYLIMSGRLGRWWRSRAQAPAAFVAAALLLPSAAYAEADSYTSGRGLFEVTYESSLDPIRINRLHSWDLTIRNAAGYPVDDAEIGIDGGMPAHDHGLPTRPRVTARLGDGRYRVDGLRFHMAGRWTLSITITADGRSDTVVIPLEL